MPVVRKVGKVISSGLNYVSTPFLPYGGAVDIIVVEQEDGSYRSTPWYVRFGRSRGAVGSTETPIYVSVNGSKANVQLYLDNFGQAFFVRETMPTKSSEVQGCKDSWPLDDTSQSNPTVVVDISSSLGSTGKMDDLENTLLDPDQGMLLVSSDGDLATAQDPSSEDKIGDVQLNCEGRSTLESVENAEDAGNLLLDSEPEMVLVSSDGDIPAAQNPSGEESIDDSKSTLGSLDKVEDVCNSLPASEPGILLANSDGDILAAQNPSGEETINDSRSTFRCLDKVEDVDNSLQDSEPGLISVSSVGDLIASENPSKEEGISDQSNTPEISMMEDMAILGSSGNWEDKEKSFHNDDPRMLLVSSDGHLLAAQSQSNEESITNQPNVAEISAVKDTGTLGSLVEGVGNTLQDSDPGLRSICPETNSLAAKDSSTEETISDIRSNTPGSSVVNDTGTIESSNKKEDVGNTFRKSDPGLCLTNFDGNILDVEDPPDVHSITNVQLNTSESSVVNDTGALKSLNKVHDVGKTLQGSDPGLRLTSSEGNTLASQNVLDEGTASNIQSNCPGSSIRDSIEILENVQDKGISLQDFDSAILSATEEPGLVTAENPTNEDSIDDAQFKTPPSTCAKNPFTIGSFDMEKDVGNSSQDTDPQLLSSNGHHPTAEIPSNDENTTEMYLNPHQVTGLSDSTSGTNIATKSNDRVPFLTDNLQVTMTRPDHTGVDVQTDDFDPNNGMSKKSRTAQEDNSLDTTSKVHVDYDASFIQSATGGCNTHDIPNLKELGFELSLCGNLLHAGMRRSLAEEVFEAHRITEEEFEKSKHSILRESNLILRYANMYFEWKKVAPFIVGKAGEGANTSVEMEDSIPIRDDKSYDFTKDATEVSSSSSRWKIWPILSRSVRSIQKNDSYSSNEDVFYDAETSLGSPNAKTDNQCSGKQFIQINIPSTEQIAALNLEYGKNRITFSVSASASADQQINASIYLWRWNARIVISDIDGTITRSDVLGQFMPFVGKDWTHSGVARFFSAIEKNGYRLLFLSARAMAQAYITRNFILNLKQDGDKLPDGPVVVSPDGLFPSLYREVIRRSPHEFKIVCLENIRALFPSGYNPFYAGFGNRDTDELAYRKLGIPDGRIFIINPKGEVTIKNWVYAKTYASLHDLVHDIFPPHFEQEEFNDANYWKVPLPEIDC